MGERGTQQVNLSPAEATGVDQRVTGVYGLKASGFLAEGEVWVPQTRELGLDWFRDVYEVLNPRRTVRLAVQLFGLYPVDNPVQASRRLRGHFYRNEHLRAVLPERLADHQDTFHAAIDWLVAEGDATSSLIAGAVGPPHQGQFFQWPDEERDGQWWLGFNVNLARLDTETGIDDPADNLDALTDAAYGDYDHVAETILREVIA